MFSFTLSPAFLEGYKDRPVNFGFPDAAGNALGEITYLRTYSRIKPNGEKERWWETCERVINGMFSIQKDYIKENRLPWSDRKAQATAQDAYERLFTFKWTPPGRGLWIMGTPLVNEQKNSAPLQNCAFVSTNDMTRADPSAPFAFLMEACMLGIGVGFDSKGADKGFKIYQPKDEVFVYAIEDSREGWVQSLSYLLNSYLIPNSPRVEFDYSLIRPAGSPIKIFGGTASGYQPLENLHLSIGKILEEGIGRDFSSVDIGDVANLIGVCVVAGNVRRSAELYLGSIEDEKFLNLKNYDVMPERAGWSWMSNNSVSVNVGNDLSKIAPGIARNGEPGVVWMDVSRDYGRLIDPPNYKDHRAEGYNPCAEQTLESFECCTLVETYIDKHESLEDYKKTLKVAYLYAKTVTILPTHWPRVNAIMQRNRRIGTSMAGITTFADTRGLPELRLWMDKGYDHIQKLDKRYSEWMCVRESIKTTTVKPGGTTPLVAGEEPGAHWNPGGQYYDRLVRFSKADPMVVLFRQAGYKVEVAQESPDTTVIVYFPIKSKAVRSEREVTLFEKANMAATAQRFWSDNSVSVTLSFDPEKEAEHVAAVLGMYEGALKTVSFLPMLAEGAYAQMPYSRSTEQDFEEAKFSLFKVDFSPIYEGKALEAVGEEFCTTDACEVATIKLNS